MFVIGVGMTDFAKPGSRDWTYPEMVEQAAGDALRDGLDRAVHGQAVRRGEALGLCAELVWHLRGLAGKRQVQGAHVGLQHNIGLGGAVVVAAYKAPQPA